MDRETSSQQTITSEYIRSVAGTRRIMSNVLNILSQQERTMRSIVTNEQRRQPHHNANELDDFIRLLAPSATGAPSDQEIDYATREVIFSTLTNPINNICPISREVFTDDEVVMQIRPCGHIFSRDNLRIWFMTSVNCPMCRYDIRNYRTRRNTSRETRRNTSRETRRQGTSLPRPIDNASTSSGMTFASTNTSQQTMGRFVNLITNDILRQLETITNDGSNNLLFEYTLLAPDNTGSVSANSSTNNT
jgi:hypothetical protein